MGEDTHTHTHSFVLDAGPSVHTCLKPKQRSQVCGIHILKVIVIGLGLFCIKNTDFMLRLLHAMRMVHQVVTWKRRKNGKP